MGKKRRSGRSGGGNLQSRSNVEPVSRFQQDETFDDSQDEFFAGKDHILLEEGPARKRQKQIEEQERYLEPSDEEVLGYDEDEDDEEDEGVYDEEEIVKENVGSADEDEDQPDSEEDGGIQDWGTSRADYYDADEIETEADALDEQTEAERLRNQFLQRLPAADMGFDEDAWKEAEDRKENQHSRVTDQLPDEAIMEDTPLRKRLQILESRYPELDMLADDYVDLQPVHEELKKAAEAVVFEMQKGSNNTKINRAETSRPVSITLLKWRALSAYLGSIAIYIAILTSPASGKSEPTMPMPNGELSMHPVMSTLFKARTTWDSVKELEEVETEEIDSEPDATTQLISAEPQTGKRTEAAAEPVISPQKAEKKLKKSRKEKAVIAKNESAKPKKAPKSKPATILTEIDDLIASIKKPAIASHAKHRSPTSSDSNSDFGDEAPLTGQEAQQKAQRTKSLRFYTSQLAQKSNKRGAASRDAGGDADLPYKERLKDRQARLMREAEKRGGNAAERAQRLDYQDDDEGEESELALAREIRGDGTNGGGKEDEEEDYYQTISSRSAAKKASRAAATAANAADAATIANQTSFPGHDVDDGSGKRGITYEIAANKGLMPRRKKEVRNPRVKKRMRYDEKMRKLGSVRQVWKGGEAKGGYGGELTGIKTNVVRSVKL